jgi:hypothetical protein
MCGVCMHVCRPNWLGYKVSVFIYVSCMYVRMCGVYYVCACMQTELAWIQSECMHICILYVCTYVRCVLCVCMYADRTGLDIANECLHSD